MIPTFVVLFLEKKSWYTIFWGKLIKDRRKIYRVWDASKKDEEGRY